MTRTEVWIATTASRTDWRLAVTLDGEVEPITAARIAASMARGQWYRLDPHAGMAGKVQGRPWWDGPHWYDVRTVRT
jgi:hypothetical protein